MEYFIAWWNVENLFDVEDSTERPDWLQNKLHKELKGWNSSVLDKKIRQLASIIAQMNANKGPDLLGLCEVENRAVLERLLAALHISGRHYAVVHADTKDARGIDVAFIYDTVLFEKPSDHDIFNHVVLKRNATRDIVQVNFQSKSPQKNTLVVLGNHWPSKLGGELASAPYRMMAAETLSYWMQRIHEELGSNVAVLVMGDFNDEPYSRAMMKYALAIKDSAKVKSKRSRNPYLFNLMWSLQNDARGTYYFKGWSMLDQMLVNRPLLRNEGGLKLVPGSCQIFRSPEMLKAGKPRRFSRPSAGKKYDPDGFSDHLPVYLRLKEHGLS